MKRKGIVFLALTSIAFGLTQAPRPALAKGECKADIQQFCKDVQPGGGRIRQCLKQNQDRLSQTCQAKLEKAKQRHLACKSDKEKFCKDVQPGEGRIKACMRSHEKDLSGQCRAYL
ncbi:MAG: cysteine rich repeat-containing protein [bacterium]